MNSYGRQIFIAGTVSLLGIGATTVLFKGDSAGSGRPAPKALGYFGIRTNEVQKRAKGHIVWQNSSEGEALYPGDAIRTGKDSEVKIQFDSGAEVELDSNSFVTIEGPDGKSDETEIKFVRGNLFVHRSSKSIGLILNDTNTHIALSDADVSLGQTEGQAIEFHVFHGTAELRRDAQRISLDKDRFATITSDGIKIAAQIFKIKIPEPDQEIFLQMDRNEPAYFSWLPLAKDYRVKFWLGTTRDNLTPIGAPLSGAQGEVDIRIKPGTYFWRLEGINPADRQRHSFSAICKVKILPQQAPSLLVPSKGAILTRTPASQAVLLSWTNPSKLENLLLEVSNDPRFRKTELTEEIQDTGSKIFHPKENVMYYWRISGFRPRSAVSVSSATSYFTVVNAVAQLQAPRLLLPPPDAEFTTEQVTRDGVFLSWKKAPGITKYRIKLLQEAKVVLNKEVDFASHFRLPSLSAGPYRWLVTSVDREKESPPSEIREVTIGGPPEKNNPGKTNSIPVRGVRHFL